MKRIGLLSDTHHFVHPSAAEFFSEVDEIWHCGDMGSYKVAEQLMAIKPLKAVYGNIDGMDVRSRFTEFLIFQCEEVKVMMTHIGGYPGRYDARARGLIEVERPGLFVCGHSHILKVIYDKKFDLLHINPGAAGKYGLHRVITMIRFTIDGKDIKELDILENKK